jgi:iron complex outermembrane recepter protein
MMSRYFVYALGALLLGYFRSVVAVDILAKTGRVEIGEQRLADALIELGRQMRVDIPFDLSACRDLRTLGVRGTLTLGRSLDTLLRDTGLRYIPLDERSVSVRLPTSQEVAQQHAGINLREHNRCATPEAVSATVSEVPKPAEGEGPRHPVVVVFSTHDKPDANSNDDPALGYSRLAFNQLEFDTLPDFLAHLPENLASNSRATYAVGDSHNSALGTSINLLGLGVQATLVLVNGHRIAPSALGDFVDVSLIPASAIERLEILTGADAAIYGADAVAGVVNIVLRKNYTGAEMSVRYAAPYQSDASQFSVAPMAGTTWSSGSLVASFTFSKDRPLLGTDRPYSDAPGFDLTPAVESYDGFFHVIQDVGSSDLSLSVDGLYARRYSLDRIRYSSDGLQVGPYRQRGVTDQYTFAPELDWRFASGWHAVAAFDLSESRFSEVTLYAADAVPSGAVFTTLSEARVRTADIRVDGTLARLPGGDATVKLGTGGRWENYDSSGTVTAAFASGSFARSVTSFYGQLHLPVIGKTGGLPLLRELDFSLAIRAEKYSDIGFSANPKIGVTWWPADTLRIDGTYDTSFAAPRYTDSLMEYNTLVIERFASPVCASGSCLVAEEFGANAYYRPERASSFNIRADWTPARPGGLRIQSGAYLIHYRDRIGTPPDTATLLGSKADFPGLVVSDPTPAVMSNVLARAAGYPQGVLDLAGAYNLQAVDFYIDGRARNLAETLATGVDLHVNYGFDSAWGSWIVGASGTRVLKFDERASAGSPYVSVADTFAHLIARHYQGLVRMHSERFDANVRVNYVGRYSNDLVSPAVPVASWTTLDVGIAVPLERVMGGVWKGSRVEVTVGNVMNREPPYVRTPLAPLGYDPVNASALGRVVGVRVVVRR